MSKYEGLVFEGFSPRTPLGAAAPAASLPDMSRFGNNGVFTNAPTWTQLPSGLWVISFVRATSQEILIANSASLNARKGSTSMAWINGDSFPAAANWHYIIDNGLKDLYFGQNNFPEYYITGAGGDRDATATTGCVVGTWYFVVGTYDSVDGIAIFVNGVSEDTGANQGLLDVTTLDSAIGNSTNAPTTKWFDGGIALPRIYNYALSADQINAIFAAERTLFGV